MTHQPILIFLGGLIVITVGAELVLRGATRIAALLGIKPILIGLTVVSIETSMPELAVGITAASEDMGPLAVGNITGTNIFNILFILGLSAAIRPLPLHLQSIKMDVPVMIAASVMLTIMALDGLLSRTDGLILIAAAIIYLIFLVRVSRKESPAMKQEFTEEFSPSVLIKKSNKAAWLINTAFLMGGMYLTIFGADLLVTGSVDMAREWGISEAVIGLTIVAIGTSAPELATTLVATYKDDRDVAVGNLIGSSITNILVILGCTCIVAPGGVDVSRDVLWVDLPLGALVAIACYPVFRSDRKVSRREGTAFVLIYAIYMAVLLLRT